MPLGDHITEGFAESMLLIATAASSFFHEKAVNIYHQKFIFAFLSVIFSNHLEIKNPASIRTLFGVIIYSGA